jgi:hypothetical protein
MLIF